MNISLIYGGALLLIDLYTIVMLSCLTMSFTVFQPSFWISFPARGIKTAISDDPSCSILKFLKFRDFSSATASPYSATVAEVGFNDASVKCFQGILGKKSFCIL